MVQLDAGTLDVLEFPRVLEELSGYARTSPGREKVRRIRPSGDPGAVKRDFELVRQMRSLVKARGSLPLAGVTDIRPLMEKASPEGAYLVSEEFLLVRDNLHAAREVKRVSGELGGEYPGVEGIISGLTDQRALAGELNRVFDEKGGFNDNASPELARIRGELRAKRSEAITLLEGMSRDTSYKEHLQEEFVTIRDDRYALAVRSERASMVRGIVHGRSGSGATVFVEPFQVVELNNALALLRKEEKAEELKILKSLTRMVLERRAELSADLDALGELDLVQAKSLFSEALGSTIPEVASSGEVRFTGARHPLLVVKERKGGDPVVPVDVVIGEGCRVLVISGANTGGKTVALKTLGLMTLMALSGIPVPAEEGSRVVAFGSIFSDIGDRQDIQASLSTFSAHVERLKEFLGHTGPGSLVLVDEIGAGTDPEEGGALALAALETFKERGSVVAVTTHLNLIKAHAQNDPAYTNASVEFDERTRKPLYKISYGTPGPSLGLSIAENLGIPVELIQKARESIQSKEIAFVESVRRLEKEKEDIEELKASLSRLEAERDRAVEKLKREREAIMKRAAEKVEEFVSKAWDEIREAAERAKKEAREAARPGGAGKPSTPSSAGRKEVEEIGTRALRALGIEREVYIPEVGDRALITGSGTAGEVVEVDREGERAELQVGAVKVWVAWDRLERAKGPARPARKKTPKPVEAAPGMEVSPSLNLIGKRVEEAMRELQDYLDRAHASGLDTVEIIHGIGTGALAKAVREYLSESPLVKDFHKGGPMGGGPGATRVELE